MLNYRGFCHTCLITFIEYSFNFDISLYLAAKGSVGTLEERSDPSGGVPSSADQGARGGHSASQAVPRKPAQVKQHRWKMS